MKSFLRPFMAVVAMSACLSSAQAAQKDATFFVVGKSPRYTQDLDGKLTQAGYYLFAEIFLNPGGTVTTGQLKSPAGLADDFASTGGAASHIKRRDFDSLEALDKAYPDGDYVLDATTPSGEIKALSVHLGGARQFPEPIKISFFQDDKPVHQAAIQPGKDVIVRWTAFKNGAEDPRGILADISFAMVSDCNGAWIARTALPFDPIPALSYRDMSFRIPAERVKAGARYKVVLEHAKMVDTKSQDGIYALATFPTVTHTYIETTGGGDRTCKGNW
ncbi:hypothetical protein [Govanella unica]|uniref:Uncharacterized protein n=1 Tax=Govanella unica TaxID=2975056 RepID=A0A9X3TVE6_9PROT|nr:hypothetical protein [Govania unica]MDA5192428.1 hypothetical protein [Govania unica]